MIDYKKAIKFHGVGFGSQYGVVKEEGLLTRGAT